MSKMLLTEPAPKLKRRRKKSKKMLVKSVKPSETRSRKQRKRYQSDSEDTIQPKKLARRLDPSLTKPVKRQAKQDRLLLTKLAN